MEVASTLNKIGFSEVGYRKYFESTLLILKRTKHLNKIGIALYNIVGRARLARWPCAVTVNGPYTEPKPKEGVALFWWSCLSLTTGCPSGWTCWESGQSRNVAALTCMIHVRRVAILRSK